MAQVILIEENKILNDLIAINLKTYLGVDIIKRVNANDALQLMAILPSIDLIITNYTINNEETFFDLLNYVKLNQLETAIIVTGGDDELSNERVVQIKNPKDWEAVIQNSAKVLGISEDVFLKKSAPDYIPIPVRYFLNIDNTNCDVFIRIKKSPTEFQFIKRIHNGDTFSKDSIKRYIDQGLENFYIPKEHYSHFTIYLSNKLIEKMDDPHLDLGARINAMGESYAVAVKEISKYGFNTETIQLTDTIIQNMVKTFERSPEMSGLLHKVINSKTGVLYQRCHMTSIVSSEILKNLNITDSAIYEKMAFASYFHDIMLVEHEELSKINSFEELEQKELNEEDWDLVFNHAFSASVLVRKYPDLPTGVEDIIKNHHGTSNGKGFSTNIEKLNEFAKIFIVAHHFVLSLFIFKEKGGRVHPIVEELYAAFPQDDMRLIIKALEKTLKKKKGT